MFGHLQCEHDCVPDCFEAPSCLAGCMQTTNLPNIICMSHAARTAAPAPAALLSNLLTELDSFFSSLASKHINASGWWGWSTNTRGRRSPTSCSVGLPVMAAVSRLPSYNPHPPLRPTGPTPPTPVVLPGSNWNPPKEPQRSPSGPVNHSDPGNPFLGNVPLTCTRDVQRRRTGWLQIVRAGI